MRKAALAAFLMLGGAAAAAEGIDPARATALERLVRQDCGSCHGMTLKGGLGRALTPQALAGTDAETLSAIVLDGLPGTAMPPWRGLLSETEALWIAAYLLKGAAP